MSELVKVEGALVIQSNQTKFEVAQLKALGLEGADEGAVMTFLHYCQRTQLDPFARQLYMIGRNETQDDKSKVKKWTIQMGIDGFRIIAQRSQEYQGQTAPQWCGEDGVWKDVWLDKGNPSAARIGIHRKGFKEPLYATALWSSYAVSYFGKLSAMWEKHGPGQLLKCAEALALRKAFPMDLSGIYEPTEMESMDYQVSEAQENKPAMVKSDQVVETPTYTDEEINNASSQFDSVEQFSDEVQLKNWFDGKPVEGFVTLDQNLLDIPVDLAGSTIRKATYAKVAELRKEKPNV